jgi:hypothetical protein
MCIHRSGCPKTECDLPASAFVKKVCQNVEDSELEPATTSTKKLRETIATPVSGK